VEFKKADLYTHTTQEIAEYVGCNYTNGAYVGQTILNMEIPTFPTPTAPHDGADAGVVHIDGIIKQENILEANMKIFLSIIWGQCTEVLHAKIEAVPGFEYVSHEADSLKLQVLLTKESYNLLSPKNPLRTKKKAKWYFYHLMQEKHSSRKSIP